MKRLEKLLRTSIIGLCCLTSLLPIPRLSLLTTCLRIIILIWLHHNIYIIVNLFFSSVVLEFADIIGIVLHLLSLSIYILAIVESMAKQRNLSELMSLRCQLQELIADHLTSMEMATFPVWRIIFLLFALVLCEIVRLWITLKVYAHPVSYYGMLIELGTQTRFLQIIMTIISVNQEAQNVTTLLKKLVAQNKPKTKYGCDIWMPYTPCEYERLNLLRFLYGRLYSVYSCVEKCFAWSIFLIIIEKFFLFVCNLFWCFQLCSTELSTRAIIILNYNLTTMLKSGLLIVVLCVVTTDVENYSRYIGSLISSLPKAWGNKAYNDLVTNFSIQALHQQFSIKAKNFFTLNRTLIGSMISAIITYSVILIQFLFVEQKPTEPKT